MLNRKFSLITASCLSIGVTLASLPQLGLGSKAIAATSSSNAQIETVGDNYIAQRGGGRRRGGGNRGQWMEELNLTDAQKAEVEAIREKYRPQMEALRRRARNASDDERQAIREEGRTLRTQIRKEIKAVLTPEQQQRAEELHRERRQNRQGRRGDRPSQ